MITEGLSSSSRLNNGGSITLSAAGNISTSTLDTRSFETGAGGSIRLASASGIINTNGQDLRSSSQSGAGGAITLTARDSIVTGLIDSSSSVGNGGNIFIDPIGDIQVASINTQGGALGRGGDVSITTDRFFRATSAFSDRSNLLSSISTAGGQGGGAITIRHGGGLLTPFIVGDATTNGTAGAVTSGPNNTILPNKIISGPYTQGNIQIITTPVKDPTRDVINPEQPNPVQTSLTPSQIALAAATAEQSLTNQFVDYLEVEKPRIKTLDEARDALNKIESATGIKPALIYAVFVPGVDTGTTTSQQLKEKSDVLWQFNPKGLSITDQAERLAQDQTKRPEEKKKRDQLQLILITAKGETVLKTLPEATQERVILIAQQFRDAVVSPTRRKGTNYLIGPDEKPAQILYQLLIAPLEDELKKQKIDNLTFITDLGLRSIPFAALHDGKQYLIEKNYSVGLMPTLSLADTRYVNVQNAQLLGRICKLLKIL